MGNKTCKTCVKVFKCIGDSSRLIGVKNAPTNIAKCLKMRACKEYDDGNKKEVESK